MELGYVHVLVGGNALFLDKEVGTLLGEWRQIEAVPSVPAYILCFWYIDCNHAICSQ